MKIPSIRNIVIILLISLSLPGFAQSSKKQELESRRQELRREIQKINQLQNETRSKEKSQLSLIEDFNYKIGVLRNLIKVTNQQANYLTREINSNQKKISDLRDELKLLKEAYASMIVKSYKSKNKQSKVMFLLSSDNFKQAYKRLQYIKQYNNYQKEQGEAIKTKTLELQTINEDLLNQKKEKDKLIAENRVTQKNLEDAKKEHEAIIRSIQKDMSRYNAQIREKQREADRIDAEIDKIIKAAIAKSNVKAGNASSSTSFALTAEQKILASNFTSNKGKLPWPVEKGFVKVGYGSQPHPLNRSLTIKSNGVKIATEKNAKARAVFDGEVMSVSKLKNMNPLVMISHGNYITIYSNLSKVYVKEGDKVITKQEIGEVGTDSSTGETVLRFVISKESSTQNPAHWIYKM